jgi:hypothetical protein
MTNREQALRVGFSGTTTTQVGSGIKFQFAFFPPKVNMKESIGIIGAGITGLATAYVLSPRYNVTIVA